MTRNILLKLSKRFDERSNNLLKYKSHDYASDSDVLSNFKLVALIFEVLTGISIKAKGVAFVLKILKLVREGNLIFTGKEPNFETVEETLVDDVNYTKLLNALLCDKSE